MLILPILFKSCFARVSLKLKISPNSFFFKFLGNIQAVNMSLKEIIELCSVSFRDL